MQSNYYDEARAQVIAKYLLDNFRQPAQDEIVGEALGNADGSVELCKYINEQILGELEGRDRDDAEIGRKACELVIGYIESIPKVKQDIAYAENGMSGEPNEQAEFERDDYRQRVADYNAGLPVSAWEDAA